MVPLGLGLELGVRLRDVVGVLHTNGDAFPGVFESVFACLNSGVNKLHSFAMSQKKPSVDPKNA